MKELPTIPELLAPAGSLDSVRAAIANGADSIYLGAGRFNARDDGAQLTMEELETACRLAHQRSRRIYLTLNTLVKPHEMSEAIEFLAAAVECGIDAAIVQDVGLITLIRKLFPDLEIHGSTQMSVHDASGAALLKEMGVTRVVLARENTLEDIRSIGAAVPGIGLETFVHGALCISYSGQCFMSGMISERSANRGSCAQSCRKGYQLFDSTSGEVLDDGFVISARDLAAAEHLGEITKAGVSCLKIEGRKKKPEYVATVTDTYRRLLDRLRRGENASVSDAEMQPLVQIFSRGFTGGMFGGREGRQYVTRTHPDNLGVVLGKVVEHHPDGVVIEVTSPVKVGDGLGFDPPDMDSPTRGFRVASVRNLPAGADGTARQLVLTQEEIPVGWRVVRSSQAELLEKARTSYAVLDESVPQRRTRLDAAVEGSSGTALTVALSAGGCRVVVQSSVSLVDARSRVLDSVVLREQLGRLGETPYALASLDTTRLEDGLFIPVSELNHLRQRGVAELLRQQEQLHAAARASRQEALSSAPADIPPVTGHSAAAAFHLVVEGYSLEDARTAADAGATDVVLDPFLRHPLPPVSRVVRLAGELAQRGVTLRLRTPTIIRPEERALLNKWLALPLPLVSGHMGLLAEQCAQARDVIADYATNCFNEHTAANIFRLGASSIVLSVELTSDEIADVVRPWNGRGFSVVAYGRPEGMTIEHCVLSAAFDRKVATCRDLCVQKHPNVHLTDPTGYAFPVATDSNCRNRLLHSRPIDGSAFMPRLWSFGIRSYKVILNVPGLPVSELVGAYATLLKGLSSGGQTGDGELRRLLGAEYTRGHFARAV